MSFFDDASLVMIPSGYKDQKVYSVKPIDGSGDLTFSRASSATRVNSSGLVERVRENLVLQSNSFDTTWTNVSSSVTSGQTGYDGTSNAWLLTKSGASGRVEQPLSTLSSASNTLSVYVKANASTWCAIEYGTSYRYLNLSTGAASSGSGGYNVQSLANGWYRFSINSSSATGTFRIYPAEADDISATSGSIFIQASQAETGDIATDYIATTSAAVSVGPVSGLPRLDYSGGATCPSLLLEPQRTNQVLWSEQMDNWLKFNSSVSSNVIASPSGYVDADKIVEDGSSSYHDIDQVQTYTAAAYTISVFAKSAGRNHIFLQHFDGTTFFTSGTFNLSNGTVSGSGSIEDYGGGWYRCSFTATTASGTGKAYINLSNGTSGNYQGDGTSGVYVWGAQLEAGSYATSYIPTLSTAVTRVQDVTSKTGIGSLIGVNQGSIYVELDANGIILGGANYIFDLSDGTNFDQNRIAMYWTSANDLNIFYGYGGTFASGVYTSNYLTTKKVAVRWTSTQLQVVINGVAQTALTYGNSSPTKLSVGIRYNDVEPLASNVKQCLLFNNTLTTAQLQELTTL